jgi:hypothetical protein
MSIEKSLYQAPVGIGTLEDNEPSLDIEIEIIPEGEDASVEEIPAAEPIGFDANLAEHIDEKTLASIASDLVDDFEEDINARKDWMQTYVDGLELLGMKIEERSEPWEGACGVYHPLLSEALVKFQAETIMETFPAAGPVKTQIIGRETPEKKESATRVQDDMNYQLTDVMSEYRPEHERMIWGLGLSGNAFKKVYYDLSLARQTSTFVPAEDIVVPYGAKDLQTSPRVTHVMRKTENEMARLVHQGFYRDVELGEPSNTLDEIEKKIAEKMGFKATTDDRYKILEMHVDLDIEGFEDTDEFGEPTGIALPYIVTIDKETTKVLAVRRNWRPEDPTQQKRNHFVHYGYVPGFGFYYFGLIHLIGAFAKSGTSLIRQLVDAGTLSNLPGGFKTKGMRVKGDDTPISPGEWRDVDVASGALKDNLLPLPYKEPSQTLMALLTNIVEEGRRAAGSGDMNISDMSANAPVGSTLALLERTLKVMSAVQARIHYSMKQELVLLRDIIRDYTPDEYTYEPEQGDRQTKKSDYDCCEVIPVSDPNAATMAQKIVQYQAVLQLAQGAPQIYNMPQLHRQMLDVLGIRNAQKLIPMVDDQKPRDPISENMDALMSKPLKAFIFQDHDAHITSHQNFLQDPMTAKIVGQSPNAQQVMSGLQAHIAEHFGFKYRQLIEQQLGAPLPYMKDDDDQLPEEYEVQLSRLVAQASTQLLQQNQAQAAQEQIAQQQQDPIIQMQMQELQIKGQEVQRKAAKDQEDAKLKAAQIENDRMRIEAQTELEGHKLGVKIAHDKAVLEQKTQADHLKTDLGGQRLGFEMASTKDRLNRETVFKLHDAKNKVKQALQPTETKGDE